MKVESMYNSIPSENALVDILAFKDSLSTTHQPEFMVLEECWNISKHEHLVLAYYSSFTEFRKRSISELNGSN